MANTTNLGMPLMAAAQSQKHITHNDAITDLDALVHLSVKSTTLTAPPGSPADGDRYLIASGATGAWVGKDLNITMYSSGAWLFFAPKNGWRLWDETGLRLLIWQTSSWAALPVVASDTAFSLFDNLDNTKIALFQLSGITTGTTRTYTLPDATGTLAILANLAQTFLGNMTFSNAAGHFGSSTAAATYNVGAGATLAATTKALNIGTAGVSTSVTNIAIGSAVAGALGTLTLNSPTIAGVNSTTTLLYLGLGGATPDATNRFSINSPAALFNNAGSTIAITLNKNAAANDASFIFQTGFSTRALFGLLATDDFTIKTSPDGSTFKNALVLDKTTAQASGRAGGALPALQIAKQTVDSARADVATVQAVFDAAFDTLALEASTTYEFEAEYVWTRAAGTTSHTVALLFGGTATFTSFGYMAVIANANGANLSNGQMVWATAATATTITGANVSATETVTVQLRGTIRSNAAGTLIPQFQYSAAPGGAMTMKTNSTLRIWPVGADTISTVGANWS